MRLLLFFFIIFTTTTATFAQNSGQPFGDFVRVSDIYYAPAGLFTQRDNNGSLADFRSLAPESDHLANDLDAFSHRESFSLVTYEEAQSVVLGFQFKDKETDTYRFNPQLRVGFSYFSLTSLTGKWNNEVTKRIDTLTSGSTNQTYFIDSVQNTNYSMNYSSEQLRLDVSVIYRSNPEPRLSLYAGLGFTAGISTNATTTINYSKLNRTQIYNSAGPRNAYYENNSPNINKTEYHQNRMSFAGSVYIPAGIDFRLSNTHKLLKQIHLLYEVRPGINMITIPELRSFANASIQQAAGFRFNIEWTGL